MKLDKRSHLRQNEVMIRRIILIFLLTASLVLLLGKTTAITGPSTVGESDLRVDRLINILSPKTFTAACGVHAYVPEPARSYDFQISKTHVPRLTGEGIICQNDPVNLVDPDGEDAVAITFPDYKITVDGRKLGGLGHAGILLINNKTGLTKYFEYGRYDQAKLGWVRQQTVPNVVIDPRTKRPTPASLLAVLEVIKQKSGQGTRYEVSYIENDNFEAMYAYAMKRKAQNDDPDRDPYSIWTNNCGHFQQDVLEAGGVDTPMYIDPRPSSYIGELQGIGQLDVSGLPFWQEPPHPNGYRGRNWN